MTLLRPTDLQLLSWTESQLMRRLGFEWFGSEIMDRPLADAISNHLMHRQQFTLTVGDLYTYYTKHTTHNQIAEIRQSIADNVLRPI